MHGCYAAPWLGPSASCRDWSESLLALCPGWGTLRGGGPWGGGGSIPGLSVSLGFPGGSVVKNLPANAGDLGSVPGSGGFLGRGNGNPLQCSCLGNPMGQRGLEGYGPRGPKESHA